MNVASQFSAVVVVALGPLAVAYADSPNLVVTRAVGCYQVVIGDWKPEIFLGADQAYLVPPKAIELTTQLLLKPGVMDDWLVARPAPGFQPSVHGWAYWEALRDNFVVITFTNGHSGMGMTVQYDPKQMRGTAWTFWDFPREHQTAPVVLRRTDCEAKRSNHRMNPSAGGGLAADWRPRLPAAGYAGRWADHGIEVVSCGWR